MKALLYKGAKVHISEAAFIVTNLRFYVMKAHQVKGSQGIVLFNCSWDGFVYGSII